MVITRASLNRPPLLEGMILRLKHWRRVNLRRINRTAIEAYGAKLDAQGWTYSVGSGGYISPDRSAIYYTNRSPYYGMVMQNSIDGDYRATIEALYKTGDFKFI